MSPKPVAEQEIQRILALVPWIVAHPGTKKSEVAARFVRIGQREARDTEVGPQLRPVEPAAGRDQHEQVVVLAAADDDRPEQGRQRNSLPLGGLLGAPGGFDPDDPVGHAGRPDRLDRRSVARHRRPGRYVAGASVAAHQPGKTVPPLGEKIWATISAATAARP